MSDRRLFNVDVEAEIRKLTGHRFKTPGEYAVELVRFAARHAPGTIEVEVSRGALRVSQDGAGPDASLFSSLATAMDPERSPERRHLALVALEEAHGLGVLAAFACRSSRVLLEGAVDGRPRGLEITVGRSPGRVRSRRREGFSITVRSRQRDPAAERRLISERCRHSVVPIRLDGKPVSRGLWVKGCLVQAELRNRRLNGTVGLPSEGNICRLVRLRHGVQVEEVMRPMREGLVFSAVVDEKDDDTSATWQTLVRAARRLYSRLGPKYSDFKRGLRDRVLDLLFERYLATRESSLLAGVPAFPTAERGRTMELAEVRRAAARGELFAIEHSDRPERFDTADRLVLRLSARQRRFLEGGLGLPLNVPPLRAGRVTVGMRWRSALRRLGKRLRRWFVGAAGKPVRDQRLSPAELNFLELVRAEVRSGTFAVPGKGRPFDIRVRLAEGQSLPLVQLSPTPKRRELRIARRHPQVRRMIRAAGIDPAYAYVALGVLAEGRDGYATSRAAAQRAITRAAGV